MLSPQLQELRAILLNDLKKLLEDQALIAPGEDSLPDPVPIKYLAERWKCKRLSIAQSWRKKGLVKLGQNRDGLLFTRGSVLDYEREQNKTSQL